MLSFQEGSSHDRGLYLRCFEELFDLSNSDTTSTSHFNFYFTACELYNDQVLIQFCQWNSTNDHLAVVPCQMNMTALSLYSWYHSSLIASVRFTQVRDLLSESRSTAPKVRMGVQESFVELVQEKVENPLEFSGALKTALQNQSVHSTKAIVSHLYVNKCYCLPPSIPHNIVFF